MICRCNKCVNAILIKNKGTDQSFYECKRLKIFIELFEEIRCPAFTRVPFVYPEKEIEEAESYLVEDYEMERIP
jgi:hypothetical protein